jgi:hypothetical protein
VIFRSELAKLILQGRKSQTRRVATAKTCRYHTGRSYSVQPGRGKSAVGRITVTDVRLETLGEINLQDARREGFQTRDEFFDYWRDLHGGVNFDLLVWVISFRLGDLSDRPRLLAPTAGGFHGDYTENVFQAMRDEPEAVSRMEQERFSRDARGRDELVRLVRRSEVPLEDRVRELSDRARRGSRDAQRALFVVRQSVERAERKAS